MGQLMKIFSIHGLFMLLMLTITSKLSEGVTNGRSASKNLFPGKVNILQVTDKKFTKCSGVIISRNMILTAAHCITDLLDLDAIIVLFGDYNLHQIDSAKTVQFRHIMENTIHPQYNPLTNSNDLVLLQLNEELILNDSIRPILLPDENFIAKGSIMFAGWGRTKLSDPSFYPDSLQWTTFQIIDKDTCEEEYRNETEDVEDLSGILCGQSAHSSVCSGDSGGGAFCWDGTKLVLCGILSYNIDCDPFYPTGFTFISEDITKWIKETTEHAHQLLQDEQEISKGESILVCNPKQNGPFQWIIIGSAIGGIVLIIFTIIVMYCRSRMLNDEEQLVAVIIQLQQ